MAARWPPHWTWRRVSPQLPQTGHDCSTVDLRTDYLRPAVDPSFDLEGKLRRAGRRLAWADAAVTTLDGRLVATARGVFTW